MFSTDDEILGLMRKEGVLKPSDGFSARVMQAIAEKKVVTEYKPLLSRRAWSFVISSFVLLTVLCWQFFARNPEQPTAYSNILEKAGSYFSNIRLSFEINSNALLIITLAVICMGLLLLIDFWFSNNSKRSAI